MTRGSGLGRVRRGGQSSYVMHTAQYKCVSKSCVSTRSSRPLHCLHVRFIVFTYVFIRCHVVPLLFVCLFYCFTASRYSGSKVHHFVCLFYCCFTAHADNSAQATALHYSRSILEHQFALLSLSRATQHAFLAVRPYPHTKRFPCAFRGDMRARLRARMTWVGGLCRVSVVVVVTVAVRGRARGAPCVSPWMCRCLCRASWRLVRQRAGPNLALCSPDSSPTQLSCSRTRC